jgi:hypothetical protein
LKPYESLQRQKCRATEVCRASRLRSQRDMQFERDSTNHETPLERAGTPRSSVPCRSRLESWQCHPLVSPGSEFSGIWLGIRPLHGDISGRRIMSDTIGDRGHSTHGPASSSSVRQWSSMSFAFWCFGRDPTMEETAAVTSSGIEDICVELAAGKLNALQLKLSYSG